MEPDLKTAVKEPRLPVHPLAARPSSIAEVASKVNAGEPFTFKLAEFLDTFYGHLRNGATDEAQAALNAEPERLSDIRHDAYLAGVAEHLVRRWSLPRIPPWTNSPERFLKEPMFPAENATAKALYFVESPIAFRRRLIFVEAQPLRRATMPVGR